MRRSSTALNPRLRASATGANQNFADWSSRSTWMCDGSFKSWLTKYIRYGPLRRTVGMLQLMRARRFTRLPLNDVPLGRGSRRQRLARAGRMVESPVQSVEETGWYHCCRRRGDHLFGTSLGSFEHERGHRLPAQPGRVTNPALALGFNPQFDPRCSGRRLTRPVSPVLHLPARPPFRSTISEIPSESCVIRPRNRLPLPVNIVRVRVPVVRPRSA